MTPAAARPGASARTLVDDHAAPSQTSLAREVVAMEQALLGRGRLWDPTGPGDPGREGAGDGNGSGNGDESPSPDAPLNTDTSPMSPERPTGDDPPIA